MLPVQRARSALIGPIHHTVPALTNTHAPPCINTHPITPSRVVGLSVCLSVWQNCVRVDDILESAVQSGSRVAKLFRCHQALKQLAWCNLYTSWYTQCVKLNMHSGRDTVSPQSAWHKNLKYNSTLCNQHRFSLRLSRPTSLVSRKNAAH